VLEYSGYGDIVVAVVRYFGGTKLGTGGLQRAYSDAVSLVLTDLPMKLKVARTRLQLTYDYSHDGSISRLLDRYDVEAVEPNYAQQVTLSIAIASSELSTFKTEVTNITAGSVELLLYQFHKKNTHSAQ
jgi:putative IMPACT (imprinted ancient) family translation regulator